MIFMFLITIPLKMNFLCGTIEEAPGIRLLEQKKYSGNKALENI